MNSFRPLMRGRGQAQRAWPYHVGAREGWAGIDNVADDPNYTGMSEIIYPRSPRETMCGWSYLPRFIDKVRLNLAGKLSEDYRPNFCKGFDNLWLECAGVKAEEFIEVVKRSITDGEVCDWVRKNVKKSEEEKKAHRERLLAHPKPEDVENQARLKMRKEQAGISHRDDITKFVDMIDADEKRI